MSEVFEQSSTPEIERANRLMGLRAHPGFRDLFQLSQEITKSLTAHAIDYPGWDLQQLMVLKVRAQSATEHHDLLFAKMTEAIREGIASQAANSNLADKSISEVLETGDHVRQEVLARFEEMSTEGRLPGTY